MIFDARRHQRMEEVLERAAAELSRADPVLNAIIRQVGPCQLGTIRRDEYFASLVEAIIYQQLAGKAAAAILARFRSLYPAGRFPTPAEVYQTPESDLRAAGLSPQKLSYIKDLSRRIVEGTFHLREIHAMEDEAVIEHLIQVKGIGRWTAQMFLIFSLGRHDVLPVNDLGILKAVQRAYGFGRMPSERTLLRLGRKWQPYRSVACWYLWASIDGKKDA